MNKSDLKKILKQGAVIEEKVDHLIQEEQKVEKNVEEVKQEETVIAQVESKRKRFVRRLAKHKFLFSMVASLGVVLVWRGLWDVTAELPVLKDSLVALLIGFAIIWFLEKYSEI